MRAMHQTMGDAAAPCSASTCRRTPAIIEAAYNDAAGVTAAFTLNLLARLNRDIGSDFDLDAFAHRASYSTERGSIETYLVSRKAQTVHVEGRSFDVRGRRSDAGRIQPQVHRRKASRRSPPTPA